MIQNNILFIIKTMKKLFLTLSLLTMTLGLMAVPAKKGAWKTIKLSDGKTVKALLKGDEWGHYLQTSDGHRYMKNGDTYVIQPEAIRQAAAKKRAQAQQRREKRNPLALARQAATLARGANAMPTEVSSPYTGDKKGLIILVNFQDVKFQDEHTQALFNDIANKDNYSENGFKGSVHDYFMAQSRKGFNLTFDVVGPVTLSKSMVEYGGNDSHGDDMNAAGMVIEAVNAVKNQLDWTQYDWDDDKEIDQVFILYAGEGEADTGSEDTIWPHEWDLYSSGKGKLDVGNDLKVNTYACANEVNATYDENGNETGYTLTGIGTICHEFSHCLGLMDMYDTDYGGFYGMNDWSLMDSGSRNGDGFIPCNYTSYERYSIGWVTPTELTSTRAVSDMQALDDADDIFIIKNKANDNEYYLLENRQKKGWDAGIPASGMLILHVDYDEDIWAYNLINTKNTDERYPLNDHQRCTIFHADGQEKSAVLYEEMEKVYGKIEEAYYDTSISDEEWYALWDQFEALQIQYNEDIAHDVYPQEGHTELTNTSAPRAFTYNANSDGRKLMNIAITNITQNSGGTMSFNFAPDNTGTEEGDNTDYGGKVIPENALFYESFDQCAGSGGNDGVWSGSIANSTFTPDNEGWTAASEKAYGADQCAKFGTTSVNGSATTPAFAINGTATLTFMAGAWDARNDGTTLTLSVPSGFTITPSTFTMTKGDWTDFEATITGTGNVKITFETNKYRFFLDEVLAVPPTTTGISSIHNSQFTIHNDAPMYNLAGQRVNKNYKGIVIQNGKKFIKK